MRYHAHFCSNYIRLGVLSLAALLLILLSPMAQIAHAASAGGWEENIELTGNFTGTFTLDSNTSQIFQVENAAPGDEWTGDITIQNKAGSPMEVALLTIESTLDDLALYNALTLDIQVNGAAVYSGSYGETPSQITPYYVLPAGSSMDLTVTVAFPAHYGNEMIGKQMDSTWTFEARYPDNTFELIEQPSDTSSDPGSNPSEDMSETITNVSSEDSSRKPSGVQTGNDLHGSNTMTVIHGVVAVFCLLAIVVTWLRVRTEKRRMDG